LLSDGGDVVDTAGMDPSRAALTLRRARELAGIEPRDAAGRLGLPTRQLMAYETGRWPVPTEVLSDAVAAYGSSEVVLPPRVSLRAAGDSDAIVVGAERIERIPTLGNRELLRRYVSAVRRQRGLGPADPVELRTADVVALAGLLDLTDADLQRQLRDVSGSSGSAAHRAARSMVLSGLVLLAGAAVASCAATPSPADGPAVGGAVEVAAVVDAGSAEAPPVDIGVALHLERGGVPSVRTGLEAFPAKGDTGSPQEQAQVPAEQPAPPAASSPNSPPESPVESSAEPPPGSSTDPLS
jgi:hypothetical protein